MLFRRKGKAEDRPVPYPGTNDTREGRVAALSVEGVASDVLAVKAGSAWDVGVPEGGGAVWRRASDRAEWLGLLEGYAATGQRVTGFSDDRWLLEAAPLLVELTARRLPLVVHHLARTAGEAAAFDALAHDGPFVLYAATAQEGADFALLARYLAEQALHPGLCIQDAAATGTSLQSLAQPEPALAAAFLGQPVDTVPSPTPAQVLLFGETRRRLPLWLDLDRPLGVGVSHEAATAFPARAAGTPFFLEHLAPLAEAAFEAFGALTGRRYDRVQGYRMDDADYVVLAEGAVVEPLLEVIDYLRTVEDVRAGVLQVTMRQPFPGARVASLLKGRKGAVVLERARPGLAGEGGLFRAVQAACARAAENGRRGGRPPYPDYDAYTRPADHPALFEAFYGDALVPPFGDLCAVVLNMLPDAGGHRHVFVGVPFSRPDVRLPKVERLQQRVHQGYPGLDERTLAPVAARPPTDPSAGLFALVATADERSGRAGAAFARACRTALGARVRTHTTMALRPGLRPGAFVTAHAPGDDLLPSPARPWAAAVVTAPSFWSELEPLAEGGLLVTHWDPERAGALKRTLGTSLTSLRRKHARIHYLDAHALAAELSPNPGAHALLGLAGLYGAFIALYPAFTDVQRAAVRSQCLSVLTDTLAVDKSLVEPLHRALEEGAARVAELPTFDLVEEVSVEPEREAPWTVQAERQLDESLYDLGRFWDSSGFLFEAGRSAERLADPFLATGTMPARSSAFHDHAPLREAMPRLSPERCTACGACWTVCPDSALPVTVQDLDAVIQTAFDRCKDAGHSFVQLLRVQKHLAPLARRRFAEANGDAAGTVGALVQGAFDALLEKMKPAADQRQALEAEFAVLRAAAGTFPLVRTATFFDEPEAAAPGEGLAFSLVVNPDACKACGLCVATCPEEALAKGDQTPERLAEARAHWRFLRALPDVAPDRIARFIRADDPATLAYHLLNRQAYHAVLGGDLAEPGSGMKTAVHLLAGLVEATLRPRVDRFVADVSALLTRIEQTIDKKLHDAVQVDDVQTLGDKLAGVDAAHLDLAALAPLLKPDGEGGIDRAWLTRLTESYKELTALKTAYVEAAHGDGRSRMVMSLADSPVTRWARTFPHNPYPFPWICTVTDGTSGLAEGVYAGVMRTMAEGFAAVRRARLYLDNAYKPAQHDAFFKGFGPADFTEDERALCPPVLVLTSNDTDALDHLVGRQVPVKVLVLEEANTLAERQAGGTPARSTALAAVTYEDVYVLQSSIGVPGHLMKGLLEGVAYDGPAVFYVYAPSPARDRIPAREVVRQARRAVNGRVVPLFSYDPRRPGTLFDRFALDGNPDADADWPQVVPEEGGEDAQPRVFTFADWAVREGGLRPQFAPPAADDKKEQVPLDAYLDLPEGARSGVLPVVPDPDVSGAMLVVPDDLVALTARYRERWRLLQALPAHRPVLGVPAETAAGPSPEQLKTYALLTQKLLAMSGFAPKNPTPEPAAS